MACVVCGHVQQREIERAAGEPSADLLGLAQRFGVGRAALTKHLATHARADQEAAPSPPAGSPASSAPARGRAGRRAPSPASPEATQGRSALVYTSPERDLKPENLQEEDEEPAPATSRSGEIRADRPSRPSSVTARAKLERLLDSLQRVVDDVTGNDEVPVAAKVAALRAMVTPLRLLMQVTGELGASDAAVLASPSVQRLLSDIIAALAPFPDALKAVHAKIAPAQARATEAAA